MSAEIWRPVVGFEEDYSVSNLGRVLSRRPLRGGDSTPREVGRVGADGYVHLHLCGDGRRRQARAHQLVLEAFVGPRPKGAVTRHLNGDGSDNRLENLIYGSHSENNLDQVAHGNHVNANKAKCPQGHPYTAENTRLVNVKNRPSFRLCKACEADRQRARRARRRMERTAA